MYKCSCGKLLRLAEIQCFDISNLSGIPSILEKAPGYACDCGEQNVDGRVIQIVLSKLADMISRVDRVLSCEEIKFLRKRLRLSREALAMVFSTSTLTIRQFENLELEKKKQNRFENKLKEMMKVRIDKEITKDPMYSLISIKLIPLKGEKNDSS